MKLLFIIFIFLHVTLSASSLSENELKKMIGQMLVVGFPDSHVDKNSQIIQDINSYNLGGVILFDRFYDNREKTKNISSPKQLQALTTSLKKLSNHPIFISVDQEGGKVARLKPKYGFEEFASAKVVAEGSLDEAKKTYKDMSSMLHINGINCNFAPVVDLEVNPKNKVIVGLERSFGKSSDKVSQYSKVLIQEQKKQGVLSVLKHFPGHGSSLGDSHLGFVDVTNTWSKEELEPYKKLIKTNSIDMIMTAHVFNSKLDEQFPATLSYNVNTLMLREELGYEGVIISDDLQMSAISKHYTLKKAATLAINSGVNILLFGNQLGSLNTQELINIIYAQVKLGAILEKNIIDSNKRIKKLYE